jgi:hypothetical protein
MNIPVCKLKFTRYGVKISYHLTFKKLKKSSKICVIKAALERISVIMDKKWDFDCKNPKVAIVYVSKRHFKKLN